MPGGVGGAPVRDFLTGPYPDLLSGQCAQKARFDRAEPALVNNRIRPPALHGVRGKIHIQGLQVRNISCALAFLTAWPG